MKELITYPLNGVDYSAEDAGLFHCTRKSGVWYEASFPIEVSGADNTIFIGKGLAWFSNTEFWGKVAAQKTKVSLDLEYADPVYDRIDVIALQFDANKNATNLIVKKGEAKTNPTIPSISRTEAVYELYLYAITRPAASLTITSANVRDLRLDDAYCGLMADSVTSLDFPVVPIEKGGTNATSVAKARENLGLGRNGGPVPLESGGTNSETDLSNAPNYAIIRKLKSGNYNQLFYTATKKGAFYATEENGEAVFGALPLECGGLGRKDINVSTPYAILRAPSDWNEYPYISTTATANGAFYATETNGQPEFGTLPIAQGGTGAKTVEDALENLGFESIGFAVNSVMMTPMGLTTSQGASEILYNKSRYVKSRYCEPQVFLNFRVNIKSNAPIYANKYYSVAKIPSNQKPLITTALNCINALTDSNRILTAHIDTDGVVWVKSSKEISTSSSVNLSITGAWVVC